MVEISVIIPVYNVEDYLNECLETVINQTFEDIEVICVNDGSTDNSLKILEEYANKDERIKIITQENKGLGASRNVGISHATGKYIFLLDSDDFIDLNTLKLLYDNAISNDSDMVIYKSYGYYTEDKSTKKSLAFNLDTVFDNVDYSKFTFNYNDIREYILTNLCSACSKLYKKEFLDSNSTLHFPEGITFEDIPYHVKSILLASRISFLPEYLYYYRVNPYSLSHDTSKRFDVFESIGIVEDFLKQEGYYDNFEEEFKAYKIRRLLSYLVSTKSDKFYDLTKETFSNLDLKDSSYLNESEYENYSFVLDSDTYIDYVLRHFNNRINKYSNNNRNLSKNNKKLTKSNEKLLKNNNQLKNKNKTLSTKNKELIDKNKVLIKKNKELQELNDSILSSNSWKITKPLRDIGKAVKK